MCDVCGERHGKYLNFRTMMRYCGLCFRDSTGMTANSVFNGFRDIYNPTQPRKALS